MQQFKDLDKIINKQIVFHDYDYIFGSTFSQLQNKKTVIFGLGECAHWFYEIAIKKYSVTPDFAVETNPSKDSWFSIPVISFGDLKEIIEVPADYIIIICLGDREEAEIIRGQFKNSGFKEVFFIWQFIEVQFPLIQFPFHEPLIKEDSVEKIQLVYQCLEDDLSRNIFLRFLQMGITKHPCFIPNQPNFFQYFPPDVPLTKGYSSFICCGSYDGENFRKMYSHFGFVKEMICYEPDPEIFGKLSRNVEEFNRAHGSHIKSENAAISNFVGKSRFSCEGGLGSHLSSTGDLIVNVTTLDSALVDCEPRFISMDIEGEEINALNGSKEVLKKFKPDLGICVYHHPSHVWEVPIFLHSLGLNYRFFLRNYTGFATETVLYASEG